jgi:hypothetical protein
MGIFLDDYGVRPWAIVTGVLVFVGILISIPIMLWNFVQVPQYIDACYNYGEITHREVEATRPNFSTVFCYVHMPNGWYDLDQINQNNVSK